MPKFSSDKPRIGVLHYGKFSSTGEPLYRVYRGDCIRWLSSGKLKQQYDFIFADPPFNIGQDYKEYNDKRADYDVFTIEWISRCADALKENGVLAIHGPDALVELIFQKSNSTLLSKRVKRIAWINWHYRFGQCNRSNWIDARCHCLIFCKGKKHTWNPNDVEVESDRATKYGDKRIHETTHGGKRLPFTVWGIPSDGEFWGRVQGNSTERVPNSPNQLPEVYLNRLILAYTNKGDRILDPFGGSGTTITVSKALNRFCDTIEISKQSCAAIVQRLKRGAVRV